MDLPKVQGLEPYLNQNKSVDIFVSAVAHPKAFWVQVISDDSIKLEKLLEDMNQIYADSNQYSFVSRTFFLSGRLFLYLNNFC